MSDGELPIEWLREGPDGVRKWNELRSEKPDEKPDLCDTNLCDASLSGANLRRANLSGADLRRADLRRADLRRADLCDANLCNANLSGANLKAADLSLADLSGANLSLADLSRADLIGADLSVANLSVASLHRANLSRASLRGANLNGASLRGAELYGCGFGNTMLIDVELTPILAFDVTHTEPSATDFRSIIRSAHHPLLSEFLRDIGMPEVFIEYNISCAQALTATERRLMLQSTFISYGSPDQECAEELRNALRGQGVFTFLFTSDAVPGQRLSRVMHEGVNEYDRVILICSKASLDRPGVLNEITETLARESRDGGAEYLIPVRLDDYVLRDWAPSNRQLAQAIRDRVVADFSDPAKFSDGVALLIRALMKDQPPKPGR